MIALLITLLITLLIMVVLVWLGFIVYDAKAHTTSAPRTEMFICQKHGTVPHKYLLKLDGLSEIPIDYCPMCMEDRFREARK
jgi:hypothetical protein